MTTKYNKAFILFFLILICSLLFISNASNLKPKANNLTASSDDFYLLPIEASKLVQKDDAILVDVREWDEVKFGMAASARWMPLSRMKDQDEMFTWFLSELPKNKLIILYCTSDDKRSTEAQLELQLRGYQTANMGDYSHWENAGFPTKIPQDQKRTQNKQ